MRKIALFVLLLFLLIHPRSFAHGNGLPPFFKIDGTIPPQSLLQVVGITSARFEVPQDSSPQSYLQNVPMQFQIDLSQLQQVFAGNFLTNSKFLWDFGDGTKGEGLQNIHTYRNMGSYLLSIKTDFNQPNTSLQTIESIQIDVVPKKDYRLPKAVIFANGKKIIDPLKDSLDANLSDQISLAASSSNSSSPVVEYLWDLGDGNFSNSQNLSYQYKPPIYFAIPSLRIKNRDGFIAYSFVTVQNKNAQNPNLLVANLNINHLLFLPLTFFSGSFLILVALFMFLKIKKRGR